MNGKLAIPTKWHETSNFKKGYAAVMDENEKWGFIDMNGKLVIPCKWDFALYYINGKFWVTDENDNDIYLDLEGNVVTGSDDSTVGGISSTWLFLIALFAVALVLFYLKTCSAMSN